MYECMHACLYVCVHVCMYQHVNGCCCMLFVCLAQTCRLPDVTANADAASFLHLDDGACRPTSFVCSCCMCNNYKLKSLFTILFSHCPPSVMIISITTTIIITVPLIPSTYHLPTRAPPPKLIRCNNAIDLPCYFDDD